MFFFSFFPLFENVGGFLPRLFPIALLLCITFVSERKYLNAAGHLPQGFLDLSLVLIS